MDWLDGYESDFESIATKAGICSGAAALNEYEDLYSLFLHWLFGVQKWEEEGRLCRLDLFSSECVFSRPKVCWPSPL